jgi:hypothetical protein
MSSSHFKLTHIPCKFTILYIFISKPTLDSIRTVKVAARTWMICSPLAGNSVAGQLELNNRWPYAAQKLGLESRRPYGIAAAAGNWILGDCLPAGAETENLKLVDRLAWELRPETRNSVAVWRVALQKRETNDSVAVWHSRCRCWNLESRWTAGVGPAKPETRWSFRCDAEAGTDWKFYARLA